MALPPEARRGRRTGRAPCPRRAGGFSLIEVMIGLAILLVGLVPLLRLQIFGMASNSGARSHMVATQLAQELVSGIERLPFADPLVAATEPTGPLSTGGSAPATFKPIVTGTGGIADTGARVWNDSTFAVPGVRTDATIKSAYGTDDTGGPRFKRRWRVYGYSPAPGGVPTVKVVAVSVVWREPSLTRPREVVLYTELHNASALLTGITANL